MYGVIWAVWAALQDPEIDRLVERLGDEQAEIREEAERRLQLFGAAALEALRRAASSSDAEAATRAARLVERIRDDALARAEEAEQRTRRLSLVSLAAKDEPLGRVLTDLGPRFTTSALDLNRRVSIDLKEAPLLQALDALGLTLQSQNLVEAQPPGAASYAPGCRFSFAASFWEPEGNRQGVVFETAMAKEQGVHVYWDVARIDGDREFPIETCALHSPEKVYVPAPDLKEARLKIRATRWWHCESMLEFGEPYEGARRRRGAFEAEIRWPDVILRSDRPIPSEVLNNSLFSSHIEVRIKPGRERDPGGRYGGRFGSKRLAVRKAGAPAWCGCIGGPCPGKKAPPAAAQEKVVRAPKDWQELSDIESITVRLQRPVEEEFEVESPTLVPVK
jgi:hypothetical protein